MPLYTGINGAVRKISQVKIGINGTVKNVSKIYGGVSNTARQIFPEYTINDLSHIEIRAESHNIKNEYGQVVSSGSYYKPYEDWYDEENSSWHGASVFGAYQTKGKTDGWFAAYSWGRSQTSLNGSIYAVFKDGSCVDLIRFLRNEAGYTKPGLAVTSYNMIFQIKDYGNGTWYYRYRFGNSSNGSRKLNVGGENRMNNTYDAQPTWDKGNDYAVYMFNANNIFHSSWEVYMQNLATGWSGSSMGFGMYPGQETATINGVSIPVRLGTSISGLTLPNV